MSESHDKFADYEQRERQINMNNIVFNKENLQLLSDSFICLYSIWIEVAEARRDAVLNGDSFDLQTINEKLQELTRSKWKGIMNIFIKDPYHGYEKGGFNEKDDMPAKLLMDLINVTTQMNNDIKTKLELHSSDDQELRVANKNLQDELTAAKKELLDVRWKAQNASTQVNTIRGNIEHLENVNREKSDQIAQLQREGTVELWEREKRKHLDKAGLRVSQLERDAESLRKEKAALQQRISYLEANLKVERIKSEIKLKPKDRADLEDDTENLKRQKFLLEKDVQKLDQELYNFQKSTVGVLLGLKEDYEKTFRPMLDGKLHSFTEDDVLRGRLIGQILRKTHEAAAHGRLYAVRADLPDSYLAIDADVKESIVKKISLGSKLRGKLPVIEETPKNEKTEEDIKRRQAEKGSHPQLINAESGCIDMIQVIKRFHHMTEPFVREHWKQFQKYDTDGNGNLDLSEMMHAMMATVGNQFTALQIQEAMLEVDVDGSDDIDFYEYLCVANMLQQKMGKSEVFKSKLVQQEGRMVSKTCIVM